MIFADKLILLRKKSGWSQEELAEQMGVTRQSISKWEGAQSIPDLDKMIRLSELFGVSTDYLLKEEIEEEGVLNIAEDTNPIRRVSLEEANAFLAAKLATSKMMAIGVYLSILSVVPLLVLGAVSETYGLPENMAGGIGMVILLILLAIAVAIFIQCSSKTASFEYLEKEIFETEYGVSGMVKERREQYKNTYTKYNIIGTCLCVLSLIPLFATAAISEENELLLVAAVAAMFVIAGIGVMFFVWRGMVWGSFTILLQEGDYSRNRKEEQPVASIVSTVYWLLVTAAYLTVSLANNRWGTSWMIWPIAGVLYPAVIAIAKAFIRKNHIPKNGRN